MKTLAVIIGGAVVLHIIGYFLGQPLLLDMFVGYKGFIYFVCIMGYGAVIVLLG